MLPEVWELERFQTAKLTFNVIHGHWQWCHSIGHITFPIGLPLQLCLYLAPFRDIITYFPKLRGHVTLNISLLGVIYQACTNMIASIETENGSCDPEHAPFKGHLSSIRCNLT